MATQTNSPDSYQSMLDAVQAFHDKHDFKNTDGEDRTYRITLMAEMILPMGTAIAANFDLMTRESRMIDGRIRVSEFREK